MQRLTDDAGFRRFQSYKNLGHLSGFVEAIFTENTRQPVWTNSPNNVREQARNIDDVICNNIILLIIESRKCAVRSASRSCVNRVTFRDIDVDTK